MRRFLRVSTYKPRSVIWFVKKKKSSKKKIKIPCTPYFRMSAPSTYLIRSAVSQQYLTTEGALVVERGAAGVFHLTTDGVSTVLVDAAGVYLAPVLHQGSTVVSGFQLCQQPCVRCEADNTVSILHLDGSSTCLEVYRPTSSHVCLAVKTNTPEQVWQFERTDGHIEDDATPVQIRSVHAPFALTYDGNSTMLLKPVAGYNYLASSSNQYLDVHRIDYHSTEVALAGTNRPSIRLVGDMLATRIGNLAVMNTAAGARIHALPSSPRIETRWTVQEQTPVPALPLSLADSKSVVVLDVNCSRGVRRTPPMRPWPERIDALAAMIQESNADIVLLHEVDATVLADLLARSIVRNSTANTPCSVIGPSNGGASSQSAIVYDSSMFDGVGGAFQRGEAVGLRLKHRHSAGSIGVVAVHLLPGRGMSREMHRVRQIEEATASMTDLSVCDAYVIAGLFNTDPDVAENSVRFFMHQSGFTRAKAKNTFPSQKPTEAPTELWGKGIMSAYTDSIPLRDLSDHMAARWTILPAFLRQVSSADRQDVLDRAIFPTPGVSQFTGIAGRMLNAVARRMPVSLGAVATQPNVVLTSSYLNQMQVFSRASQPGEINFSLNRRHISLKLKHIAYLSLHAHLLKKQQMPTAMLLVHLDDWEVLSANKTMGDRAFGDDFGIVTVSHHARTTMRLPAKSYMAVFRFPPDLLRIPHFSKVMMALVVDRPLPVGNGTLQPDETIKGTVVPSLKGSVSPSPTPDESWIDDNSRSFTRFRVTSVLKGSYVDVHALMHCKSGEMVAMMSTLDLIDDASSVCSVKQAMQDLEKCNVSTKLCHTQHKALVFRRDTKKSVLITPAYLAMLLRDPHRGPCIREAMKNVGEYAIRWIEAYAILF